LKLIIAQRPLNCFSMRQFYKILLPTQPGHKRVLITWSYIMPVKSSTLLFARLLGVRDLSLNGF